MRNLSNSSMKLQNRSLSVLSLMMFAIMNLASLHVNAQVSLTATGGTTSGSYTTLNDAFGAINAGTHQGVITIAITGNTTEPATPIPLLKSGGASAYTSITISPSGGNYTINSAPTPTAYRSVIELYGADNVTIDGDDPLTTGNNNLTIQVAPSSNATSVITLGSKSNTGADGATNNTIKNCNIIGGKNSATSFSATYGILFSSNVSFNLFTQGSVGNTNITIQNNIITRCYYGIYAEGDPTYGYNYPNTGLKILNNIIGSANSSDNITGRAIDLSYTATTAGPGSAIIDGNDIRAGVYFSTTGISTSVSGIYLTYGNEGCIIRNNKIHDISQPSSSGWGAYGIMIQAGGSGINIYNNFFADITAYTSTTSLGATYENYALFVFSAATGIIFNNNTISLQAANWGTTPNTFSACINVQNSTATFAQFLNNILVNTQNSTLAYGIYTAATTNISGALMDNNNYYVPNGKIGYYNGTTYATLASWQTATGKDGASENVLPSFVSQTDLHIQPGTSANLDSAGVSTAITGVTTDIDAEARNTLPDIGADEFAGPLCTGAVGGTISATDPIIYGAGSTTIKGSGYSRGSTSQYSWEVSATGNVNDFTATGQTNPKSFTTGTITSTTYYRLKVTCGNSSSTDYSNIVTITVLPAQISLTATGGTTSGFYNTLKAAFDAINAGTHTGSIAITITASTTETATAALNASGGGAASYSNISIQPSGNVTVTGNIASQLINLNGADNVVIDGLNSSGNSLTISNTSTGGANTIQFINDASNNTITNCTILGSAYSTVYFSTGTTTGNDNNKISSSNIGPAGSNLPTNGIRSFGSTTNTTITNSNDTITGCNIYDFFSASSFGSGIDIIRGNASWVISNNRFYQTAPRTQTSTGSYHRMISIDTSPYTGEDNFQVTGNILGYASPNGTGTYSIATSSIDGELIGIYFYVYVPGPLSVIQNNTIANISYSGPVKTHGSFLNPPFAGIYAIGGPANITGNTIGSSTGTGSINVSSSSTSYSNVYGIYDNSGTTNASVTNNTVGSITVNNTSTGDMYLYGIFVRGGNINIATITNNTVGSTSTPGSLTNSATSTSSSVFGITDFYSIANISNNTVANLTTSSPRLTYESVIGINVGITASTTGHNISQNVVHSLSNTNSTAAVLVTGVLISALDDTGPNTVKGNFVHSLSVASNSPSAHIRGIHVSRFSTTYSNNMVRLGIDANGASIPNGCIIEGIYENGGINNYYFNSVYIGGSGVTGSANTYSFRSTVTNNTRIIRDNIFYNARSNGSGTGKHYAVQVSGTGTNPAGLTINNNIYFADGAGGYLGTYGGSDISTLSAWQAAIGQDANSYFVNPQFINPAGSASAVDLHISSSLGNDNLGVPVGGISTDYDAQTRNASTPDIGADEFDGPPCSGAVGGTASTAIPTFCNSGSATITASGYSSGTTSSYVWESSATGNVNDFTATGQTNPASFTTGTITSTMYYRLKVTCGNNSSTAYSNVVTITIDPAATVNAGTDKTICYTDNSGNLNGTIGGSASSATWSTSGDGTFNNTGNLNAIYTPGINDKAAGTVTLTLTTNDPPGSCGAASDNLILTINPQLNINVTAGTIQCVGGKTSVTVTASGGTPPYSGTGTFNNVSAGTYTYTITDAKSCTASQTITIQNGTGTAPATPGLITGPQYNLCGGGTFTYTIAPVATATSYIWTVPAGFTLVQNNGTSAQIQVPSSFTTSAQIKVAASNFCGTSAQSSLTVYAVAPNPSTGIVGPTTVTSGQTGVVYKLPNGPGVTYTWIVPAGATIVSGQGTFKITVNFGSTSGYVKVTVSNACGSAPQGKLYVTVGISTKATPDAITKFYLKAFPNPTQSIANVLFNADKAGSKFEIVVTDVYGKAILRKAGLTNIGDNILQLDMSRYANAMYLIKLVMDDEVRTVKLYKER